MTKVVLGGGLSGLSAAYYLLKKGGQKIVLVESSNRIGGWIKSNKSVNNVIFEQGPRTIRPRGEQGVNTLGLIEDLGLSDKVVPVPISSPAARNRMIYANGRLTSLPSSIKDFFTTNPPFTQPLIRQVLNDVTASKVPLKDDSIYNFIERRFGQECADYLISPLICGICAGNAKEISVNFLMKHLFEYEQKYGSITNGMVFNLIKSKPPVKDNKLSFRAKQEKWSVYSLRGGIETLTATLEDKLKDKIEILRNQDCEKIETDGAGVKLYFKDGSVLDGDCLISSIPSYQLSKLVLGQHPDLANILNKIPYVTVGVVNLFYDKPLIKKDGFGFLVPPKEGLPILGTIFDSCCFPYGKDKTVLTVMMGGHWFDHYFGKNATEATLLETATQQLKSIMDINEKPVEHKVNILRNCIPQYLVGHNENLENIDNYIRGKSLPILLCGAAYQGVGVNDVILSAKKAVDRIS